MCVILEVNDLPKYIFDLKSKSSELKNPIKGKDNAILIYNSLVKQIS